MLFYLLYLPICKRIRQKYPKEAAVASTPATGDSQFDSEFDDSVFEVIDIDEMVCLPH